MGAVDEQFLGHAAANDAGAANLVLFGDRHPGAVGGGNARGTHAARTRADDEKVVIELLGHSASPNARSIKALVEGSKSNASPLSMALAISLPNSTPNWSNGLMKSGVRRVGQECAGRLSSGG